MILPRSDRPSPEAAARSVVAARYPDALAAFLGGSVTRGAATPTSDLDIVIIVNRPEAPFRESFIAHGWPVEAFIHTPASYRRFFAQDAAERTPALPRMCREGIILCEGDGLAARIRAEARALLDAGPAALAEEDRSRRRYMATDLLDDFRGATTWAEACYVAGGLADCAANLRLAMRGAWGGSGKSLRRALSRLDPAEERRLTDALRAFYQQEDRGPLIAYAESALAEAGGELFDGYYQAAPRDPA
ncbi:MAG TPA: nucleotidyltransferase domain-containing protein [Armatimonadota bacterium]